jgi:hypothetical protein
MTYVSFVYSADASMLCMLVDRLRMLDPQAVIFACSDPASPLKAADVPEGVIHLTGSTPRSGNLNGLAFVGEELKTFLACMDKTGASHVVKIDADCYPLKLDALREPSGLTICERWQPFTPAGMVYAISRDMAESCLDLYKARFRQQLWQEGAQYPEDQTIYGLAALSGLKIDLLPYGARHACGMPDKAPDDLPTSLLEYHFVHCGEPLANGQRIAREHATLRMRCLHARVLDTVPL